jgi:CHAT domain-containing protein
MDYAVSSYTPTVASLTQRVRVDQPIDQAASGLFLTSQPKAPGACPIPGTTKEASSIYSKATEKGVRTMLSEGDSVTPDECLKHMEDFSSIHLACHATQDASEPLRSKFIFHKGKLELQAIMQRNLKNADLAFLSACETSTGEETLPDEAVHLAAGMLAAGYRRVVATMWSIGDKHAATVASDFYQYLWENRDEGSGGQFDGTLSACALHHAIWQLRDRLDNSDRSLLAWIPYVHFGY